MPERLEAKYLELVRSWVPPRLPARFENTEQVLAYRNEFDRSYQEAFQKLRGLLARSNDPRGTGTEKEIWVVTEAYPFFVKATAIRATRTSPLHFTTRGDAALGDLEIVDEAELTDDQRIKKQRILDKKDQFEWE